MAAPFPNDIRLFGPLKPMRFEATVEDCVVAEGEIPEDLAGGFYRVGPSWKRPTKQGTVGFSTMDGMVQGLVIRDGKADFRNRWIRTPKYLAEERAGRGIFEWSDGKFTDWRSYGLGDVVRDEHTTGVPQGTNLINVFPFAGQMVTSGEQGGPPIALDPITLETTGVVPWSAALSRGMVDPACYGDNSFTAHPKWDAKTGELFGWTYRDEEPFVTLHWVKPDGSVRTRPLWDAPYATNAHDMWLTEKFVVLPFQPFTVDRKRISKDLAVFGWDPELPTVLCLIPRDDIDGEIRWITADIETQYIMHTMSANHVGDELVLDGPIFDRPPFPFEDQVAFGTDFIPFGTGVNGRWTVDLKSGQVTSERLDDRAVEFPKVDERFYGRPYEWGFLLAGQDLWSLNTFVRRNVRTGNEESFKIESESPIAIFEPTFIPRSPGSPEGDGYVMMAVSYFMENRGDYLLFDTNDITDGPIARIELPFPLGWTPHGHWMDFRS
jgi:carotenoid cleavage dioxygenase